MLETDPQAPYVPLATDNIRTIIYALLFLCWEYVELFVLWRKRLLLHSYLNISSLFVDGA